MSRLARLGLWAALAVLLAAAVRWSGVSAADVGDLMGQGW